MVKSFYKKYNNKKIPLIIKEEAQGILKYEKDY